MQDNLKVNERILYCFSSDCRMDGDDPISLDWFGSFRILYRQGIRKWIICCVCQVASHYSRKRFENSGSF